MGLRTRGVLPSEVAGGVRALQRVMVPVPASHPEDLIDTCGTGGGALTTFNISTAAALVAARRRLGRPGGVPVAAVGLVAGAAGLVVTAVALVCLIASAFIC